MGAVREAFKRQKTASFGFQAYLIAGESCLWDDRWKNYGQGGATRIVELETTFRRSFRQHFESNRLRGERFSLSLLRHVVRP